MRYRKATWAGLVISDEDTTVKRASHLKVGDVIVLVDENKERIPYVIGNMTGYEELFCLRLTTFQSDIEVIMVTEEFIRDNEVYWAKLDRNIKVTKHDVWLAVLSLLISILIPFGQYNLVKIAFDIIAIMLYFKSNIWRA